MKIALKAFVYELDFGCADNKDYAVFNSAAMGDTWYTLIGPIDIEYEIPASFNSTLAKVAALEKAKYQTVKDHAQTMAIFEEQISKLLCITMDEVPA